MPKYKPSEFARLVGKQTAYISMQVKRDKLRYNADGDIDTGLQLNSDWLEEFMNNHGYVWGRDGYLEDYSGKRVVPPSKKNDKKAAGKQKEPVREKTEAYNAGRVDMQEEQGGADESDDFEDDELPDKEGVLGVKKNLKRRLHYQAEKLKTAKELDELKIRKLQGDLVPVEPLEQVIFRFKQGMLTGQKTVFEGFLNEVAHKYAMSAEDIAYYRGYFIKKLNGLMDEVTDNAVDDLDIVLNEFTVKRGRGDRG